MFTGLIECTGRMIALRRNGERAVLEVSAPLPTSEIRIGDSVAVNGACLTVVSMQGDRFGFDVSPETVSHTTFTTLQAGNQVNIERALRLGERLDGHLVTGHIDCVGRLESRLNKGNAVILLFNLPREHCRMLVGKGSVAIDGISLTVNEVTDKGFSVSIIPHTLEKTSLNNAGPGKEVNIETDVIGKYVSRLVGPYAATNGLTMEKLMQNGFI